MVSVLLLLQTRGRMTAARLATELEVSVRTVYRDVGALTVAGVPIRAVTGPVGGFELLDGYRTRLTGLTRQEAESLVLASIPAAAADLGLSEVASAARLKLLAALPPGHRESTEHWRDRFHVDARDWYAAADDTAALPAVIDAVGRGMRLRLRYRRWTAPQEVERAVDPLGVVLKAGRWYLVASVDGRPRTYRVARILEWTVLAEEATRPPGFDLTRYWESYQEGIVARLRRDVATVRLSPAGVAALPDVVDPVVVAAVSATARECPDGRTEADIPVEDVPQATQELLRLGPDVEVLAPPSLRRNMIATTRAMAARYADDQR